MVLTERQRTILNAVIERYIGTGTPVSSKELVGVTGLAVSSSTIRNEFALLEERATSPTHIPPPDGSPPIWGTGSSSITLRAALIAGRGCVWARLREPSQPSLPRI